MARVASGGASGVKIKIVTQRVSTATTVMREKKPCVWSGVHFPSFPQPVYAVEATWLFVQLLLIQSVKVLLWLGLSCVYSFYYLLCAQWTPHQVTWDRESTPERWTPMPKPRLLPVLAFFIITYFSLLLSWVDRWRGVQWDPEIERLKSRGQGSLERP